MNYPEYFLGGNSPTGFRSNFAETLFDTDYYACIIKGGPGTGKSSLMKKLAEAFPDEEKEIYHCSSDPDSLDAVVFKERRVILVDGTAPHTFDPEYPGAAQQILDLGACWDAALLNKNKDGIIAATKGYLRHQAGCRRFITALAAVTDDTANIGRLALNEEKLEGFIGRLSAKVLPRKNHSEEGRLTFRQMSALTPDGYVTYLPKDCAVYMLNDGLYAGSEIFLRRFADAAAGRGYDVSVSICTLYGEETFEHILIPELNLAFMSANPINELTVPARQPINFRRFYDKTVIREKKARICFNETAAENLRNEAVLSLINARAEHDALEEYYIEAVDFDKVNRIYYSMVSRIKSL